MSCLGMEIVRDNCSNQTRVFRSSWNSPCNIRPPAVHRFFTPPPAGHLMPLMQSHMVMTSSAGGCFIFLLMYLQIRNCYSVSWRRCDPLPVFLLLHNNTSGEEAFSVTADDLFPEWLRPLVLTTSPPAPLPLHPNLPSPTQFVLALHWFFLCFPTSLLEGKKGNVSVSMYGCAHWQCGIEE